MPDVQKLVIRSGTKVEIAPLTAGVPGTYVTIVPRGSVQIQSQFGTQTYADFGTALGALAAVVPDGDRTVSVTFNAFLIPSDAAFTAAEAAHDDADEIALRVTLTDRAGAGTWTRAYRGFIPSFNITANQDGAAEVAINFNASSIITP